MVSTTGGKFAKYMLLQLPGYILTALVMSALCSWLQLPVWIVAVAVLIGITKDLLLFRAVRNAFAVEVPPGIEQLKGARAVAQGPLDPDGYVKVRGELWRARPYPGEDAIPAGSRVIVRDLDGMVLIVSRDMSQ